MNDSSYQPKLLPNQTNELTDYVIIDTETTGLSQQYDRVIEVGAIRVRNHKVVDTYSALVRSVNRIPHHITRITGIDMSMMIKEGQPPLKVMRELKEFIANDVFVAHNVYFDFRFINQEFDRYTISTMKNPRVCTMRTCKKALPDLPNHKLTTIKNYFKVDYRSHRALTDSYVCWEIMRRFSNHATVYDKN